MGYKVETLARKYAQQMAAMHEDAFHTGWSEDDFIDAIDKAHDDVLGLIEDDRLIGFILVRTQIDQAEILTLVVDRLKRGCGQGALILQSGEQAAKARGADIMFLEVAKDNLAAIALYQRAGYQRCGTRKAYYRREKGRVDALLFQKKLS